MPKRSRPTSSPALVGAALLETLLGGWRALSRLEVDGFAVQRSRGVTRRANSVVPIDPPTDTAALDAALTRIESLLGAAGETPTFRLFTADGLDHEPVRAALTRRGYEQDAPVHVLQRALSDHRTAPDSRAAITVGAPPEDWLGASWRLAPRPEEGARETLRDLMAGTPAIYLALTDPESREIDAVGPDGRGSAEPSCAPCSPSPPSRARTSPCSRSRPGTPPPAPCTAAKASRPAANTATSPGPEPARRTRA